MEIVIWILIGYLSGSIPIGYLFGKLKGIDLTKEGSGSVGATNVLRKVGKIEALITLVFDVLKGFLCVYLAIKFVGKDLIVVLTGIMCILGHSKSIFLKFKGGKSSATGLGILIAISYEVALITILIWVTIVFTTRYSSLGSIIAIPLTPVFLFCFHKPLAYVLLSIFAAIYIVFIRHRDNIRRLLSGTELKIG